jgi:hypothetical protein
MVCVLPLNFLYPYLSHTRRHSATPSPTERATIWKASPYLYVNHNENSEMRARLGERAFPEGVYNEVND